MSVQILVEAAVNKQSSQFMEIFEKIILSKVAEKLNERRQEVAQNLFKEAATIIPFPKKNVGVKPGIKPPVKHGSQTSNVKPLGTKVPLSQVFKAKPVSEVPVKHEYYSWGRLTKVGDDSGSAVLQPEQQQAVLSLKKPNQAVEFVDDQNKPWKAVRQGDQVQIETTDASGLKFKFRYADLLQQK